MARTSGSSKSGVVTTSGSVTGSTTRARSTSPAATWGTSWCEPASTTDRSMPGWLVWNATRAGASALVMRLGVAPTARRPRAMPDSARASAPGGLHVGQDPLHEGQQGGAVGREGDRPLAGAPVEEQHPELVLEQADLARQRGLGQVQAGGGLGEALLLGHGQGVGQLVELHWDIQSLSL